MNVIVIMEDSARKDHFGCYGNDWIRTPNIDKLAADATVFDYAYAEGLPTIPARVSLFTGRYTLPVRGWQPLEQNDVLLAELLWDKGFTSSLIADTYHMHKPQMGFSRGFDYVQWIRGQENDPTLLNPNVNVDSSKFSSKNWHPVHPGQPERIMKRQFEMCLQNSAHWKSEEDHHIAMVVNAGITWLENMVAKGKSNNLFLWLDSFDPHEPWDPPDSYTSMYPVPEYDGLPITWGGGFTKDWTLAEIRHLRSQYAGTITLVDKWTGIFLEKVEELGLLDNTMIIFLSDHGEPLGEHGIIKKIQPWPYDELSRIPLIVKLPDAIDSQERVDAFVGLPDITPTILSFLEIRTPPVMQGMDLLPLIKGEETGASFGISGFHSRSWSLRDHERSYYLWLGTRIASGVAKKPELYKYDTHYVPPPPSAYVLGDQAEKKNLFADELDVADRLENELRTFVEALSPSPGDLMASEFMKRKIVPRK